MPTHAPDWDYGDLLGRYLRPQWRRVAWLLLLLLAGIALHLLNPQILRLFIDSAAAGAGQETLLGAGLVFLLMAFAAQAISVAETYLAEQVGLTATNRLRADLTLHCLRLDPSFHAAHTPGELIERIDGDVATLGNFFSRFVVHLLGNGLLLLGVIALLFQVEWRVGVTLAAFVTVALLAMNALRARALPLWTSARQARAELFGFLEERLLGTEDIRANGATAYVMRRLYERSRGLLRSELRAGVVGVASWSSGPLLLGLGTVVALALGASLYHAGAITIGTVYVIFHYTQLLTRPLEQITRQVQDLQQATAGIVRVRQLFSLRSAVADGVGTPLSDGALAVACERVTFGYTADGPPVLRDVSFQLRPGEVLGLLGRTGSGKTTLTRLVFRLYDPWAGTIHLGGVDLRAARLADVRSRVGLVTQEIQLFHASVRDNLAFFDHRVSDARIVAALAELGLDDWLASLPDGLDTLLAPDGRGLSAGEGQLLAFARVFLRNPGLVVLDEASSRLDPATERRLERAVTRLLAGRTAIVIAHRLATVQRADTILVLDQGGVREYGARATLAADPTSHFARLLRAGRLAEVLA